MWKKKGKEINERKNKENKLERNNWRRRERKSSGEKKWGNRKKQLKKVNEEKTL